MPSYQLARTLLLGVLSPLKSLGLKFPKRLTRHLHYHGTVSVRVDAGKQFKMKSYGHAIENNLYWYGLRGHEPETVIPWLRAAAQANVVLDIGANTGLFSFAAAAQNKNVKIYAFEPLPRVAEILRENADLNPQAQVTVVERAVSDEPGVARIFDPGGDQPASASLRSDFLSTDTEPVDVATVDIDSFLAEDGVEQVDLIKLDVEGVEEFALRGMRSTIEKYKPAIFMEMVDERPALVDAIRELTEMGYQIVSLTSDSQEPGTSQDYERNVLLATDPNQFVSEGEFCKLDFSNHELQQTSKAA